MALSMRVVGVVTTSPTIHIRSATSKLAVGIGSYSLRKSKAAGPGCAQLFTATLPLARCCASFSIDFCSIALPPLVVAIERDLNVMVGAATILQLTKGLVTGETGRLEQKVAILGLVVGGSLANI